MKRRMGERDGTGANRTAITDIAVMMKAVAAWPTPTAVDRMRNDATMQKCLGFRQQNAGQKSVPLYLGETMTRLSATWPTPAAADLAGGRTNPPGTTATGLRPDGKKAQIGLPAVMKGTWPTPTARDGFPAHKPEYVAKHKANGHGMSNLNDYMDFAALPSGPTPSGSPATTEKRGAPNPAFPCWLMGYKPAWLNGADLATPSSRKSRRK